MKELLVKFLNEKFGNKYRVINNEIHYFHYGCSLYKLDKNGNLLNDDEISKYNDEWFIFLRKEKLKILNTLENERIIG